MAVALFGMISVITFTTRSNMATRENMLAMRAAEKKIEEMKNTNFADIFTTFNAAAEQTFDINPSAVKTYGKDDLVPFPPDAKVGKVKFPVNGSLLDESQTGALMSNLNGAGAVADFDLNGDGKVGGTVTTYMILPVVIEIHWKGVQGERKLSYKHIFFNK